MASIWKNPKSRYWTACFRDSHGRQKRLSTKTTDRRIAQRIADEFEKSIRNRRTFSQLQKVLSRYHEELCGEVLQQQSLRGFGEEWLRAKNPTVARSTFRFYRTTVAKLLTYFGNRVDEPITTITRSDLVGFRNHLAGSISPHSLNHDLIAVRMIFRDAKRDSVLAENPAEFLNPVRLSRGGDSFKRRAFTLPELRALLSVSDPEWKSMIRIGLYTGARLGDIAMLRWSNVDLERGELCYVAQKTAKPCLIPIVGALQNHFASLPSSDDPREFLHPRAAVCVSSSGYSAQLSQQFGALLVQAGLRAERSKSQSSKGRYTLNPLSFHSLRHTAVSLLKDAGIPAAVVMELVGHSSAQLSQLYTHVGREALERASEALPTI